MKLLLLHNLRRALTTHTARSIIAGVVLSTACMATPACDRPGTQIQAIFGDQNAQYELGCHYYENKDYISAIKWLAKAANQGHTMAEFKIKLIVMEDLSYYPIAKEALKK